MPSTTTKVVTINADVLSHATEMERLLVSALMKDIRSNLLSIETAKAEICAVLSKYTSEDRKEVFTELMASNN